MKIKRYGTQKIASSILSAAGLASIGLLIATTATIAFAITYTGTNFPEVLPGTPLADTIRGAGGDDRILGFGGNDRLYGGSGHDRLTGGAGGDYFNCGAGVDTITDYYKQFGDTKTSDCEKFGPLIGVD
jgi:RTX calcium-binding nonapeptide repeat (4 copies)